MLINACNNVHVRYIKYLQSFPNPSDKGYARLYRLLAFLPLWRRLRSFQTPRHYTCHDCKLLVRMLKRQLVQLERKKVDPQTICLSFPFPGQQDIFNITCGGYNAVRECTVAPWDVWEHRYKPPVTRLWNGEPRIVLPYGCSKSEMLRTKRCQVYLHYWEAGDLLPKFHTLRIPNSGPSHVICLS
jgi:hypothetical protein